MATRTFATIFVACVGLVAGLCLAFALASASIPPGDVFLLAVLCSLLMAAATIKPVHFGFRVNVDLTTLLIFSIALSFTPSIAIIVVASGVLAGQAMQRSALSGLIFNSGQVIVQITAAAGILAFAGWNATSPDYGNARFLPFIIVTAVAIFAINTALVATVVGLQTRLPPWLVWRDALSSDLLLEQVTQFALGLVTAIVGAVQVLLLPLLAAPGIMLYISANRKRQLDFQTQDAISALADLVDRRDPYTADHSRRVAVVARELATHLKLAPAEVGAVERAARVHDLGKLVIDLSVLNKDEKLSRDEWDLFKRHPGDGANILTWFPEFQQSTAYVHHHHERWDGSGYPDGLARQNIPLGARIIAVADALDAMSSARPYRDALSAEEILAEFRNYRDVQWDATVVDVLLELVELGTIDLPGDGRSPRVYDGLGTVVHTH